MGSLSIIYLSIHCPFPVCSTPLPDKLFFRAVVLGPGSSNQSLGTASIYSDLIGLGVA